MHAGKAFENQIVVDPSENYTYLQCYIIQILNENHKKIQTLCRNRIKKKHPRLTVAFDFNLSYSILSGLKNMQTMFHCSK